MLHSSFTTLAELASDSLDVTISNDVTFKLFGCTTSRHGELHALPRGLFSLFLILWKFIIFGLVQHDKESIPYSKDRVWRATLDRFRERAEALAHLFKLKLSRAAGQAATEPSPAKFNAALYPLAQIDDEGGLTYHPKLAILIVEFKASPAPPPTFSPETTRERTKNKAITFVRAKARN